MIYTPEEVAVIKQGGQYLAQALAAVVAAVIPGVTTKELDAIAEQEIRAVGAEPSFLNYAGPGPGTPFPSTLCTSINHEVVHAPPVPARVLKEGDIIGLDIGLRYQGFCTDMAVTVGVGKINEEAKRLIRITRESLEKGISAARAGGRVRDISAAVQTYVESHGYSIVRDLVGHGVGRAVHEDPEVPNFVIDGPIGNEPLKEGLVIAIEPMVNMGKAAVHSPRNQWAVITKDKSLSAHFEHTIVVTSKGPVVLTAV